ncbi:hypothetical protein B0H19DRAFT_1090752 [Mycena capillaripes]|nr:hypothetical protein B0H19DRAFT_1090752 [Mycena capillaripes]
MSYPSILTAAALSLLFLSATAQVPDPLICEDSIDGKPPFQSNAIPCIIGCNCFVDHATLSFLPGSVNTTCFPYCNLNCVHKDPTPAQVALAPDCWDRCQVQNDGVPEHLGWCMFWCVEGSTYTDLVTATKCIPSLSNDGAPTTTVVGGVTVTFEPLSNPPEWQSWFQTQTVIPRTGTPAVLPSATPPPPPSNPISTPNSQSSSFSVALPTPSSLSGSKTSSTASASPEADSASPETPQTGMAVSISRADPWLLSVLSFALYIGARFAWD